VRSYKFWSNLIHWPFGLFALAIFGLLVTGNLHLTDVPQFYPIVFTVGIVDTAMYIYELYTRWVDRKPKLH